MKCTKIPMSIRPNFQFSAAPETHSMSIRRGGACSHLATILGKSKTGLFTLITYQNTDFFLISENHTVQSVHIAREQLGARVDMHIQHTCNYRGEGRGRGEGTRGGEGRGGEGRGGEGRGGTSTKPGKPTTSWQYQWRCCCP